MKNIYFKLKLFFLFLFLQFHFVTFSSHASTIMASEAMSKIAPFGVSISSIFTENLQYQKTFGGISVFVLGGSIVYILNLFRNFLSEFKKSKNDLPANTLIQQKVEEIVGTKINAIEVKKDQITEVNQKINNLENDLKGQIANSAEDKINAIANIGKESLDKYNNLFNAMVNENKEKDARFDKLGEQLAKYEEELKEKVKKFENDLKTASEDDVNKKLNYFTEQVKKQNESLNTNFKEEIEKFSGEKIKLFEEKLNAINEANKKTTEIIQENNEETKAKIENLEEKIENIQKIKLELETEFAKYEESANRLNENNKAENQRLIDEAEAEFNKKIQEAENKIKEIENKKNELNTLIEGQKEAFNLVKEDLENKFDQKIEALKTAGEENKEELEKTFKEKLNQTKNELTQINDESVQKQNKTFDEKINEVNEKQTKLNDQQKEILEIEKVKAEEKKEVENKKNAFIERNKDNVKDLIDKIEEDTEKIKNNDLEGKFFEENYENIENLLQGLESSFQSDLLYLLSKFKLELKYDDPDYLKQCFPKIAINIVLLSNQIKQEEKNRKDDPHRRSKYIANKDAIEKFIAKVKENNRLFSSFDTGFEKINKLVDDYSNLKKESSQYSKLIMICDDIDKENLINLGIENYLTKSEMSDLDALSSNITKEIQKRQENPERKYEGLRETCKAKVHQYKEKIQKLIDFLNKSSENNAYEKFLETLEIHSSNNTTFDISNYYDAIKNINLKEIQRIQEMQEEIKEIEEIIEQRDEENREAMIAFLTINLNLLKFKFSEIEQKRKVNLEESFYIKSKEKELDIYFENMQKWINNLKDSTKVKESENELYLKMVGSNINLEQSNVQNFYNYTVSESFGLNNYNNWKDKDLISSFSYFSASGKLAKLNNFINQLKIEKQNRATAPKKNYNWYVNEKGLQEKINNVNNLLKGFAEACEKEERFESNNEDIYLACCDVFKDDMNQNNDGIKKELLEKLFKVKEFKEILNIDEGIEIENLIYHINLDDLIKNFKEESKKRSNIEQKRSFYFEKNKEKIKLLIKNIEEGNKCLGNLSEAITEENINTLYDKIVSELNIKSDSGENFDYDKGTAIVKCWVDNFAEEKEDDKINIYNLLELEKKNELKNYYANIKKECKLRVNNASRALSVEMQQKQKKFMEYIKEQISNVALNSYIEKEKIISSFGVKARTFTEILLYDSLYDSFYGIQNQGIDENDNKNKIIKNLDEIDKSLLNSFSGLLKRAEEDIQKNQDKLAQEKRIQERWMNISKMPVSNFIFAGEEVQAFLEGKQKKIEEIENKLKVNTEKINKEKDEKLARQKIIYEGDIAKLKLDNSSNLEKINQKYSELKNFIEEQFNIKNVTGSYKIEGEENIKNFLICSLMEDFEKNKIRSIEYFKNKVEEIGNNVFDQKNLDIFFKEHNNERSNFVGSVEEKKDSVFLVFKFIVDMFNIEGKLEYTEDIIKSYFKNNTQMSQVLSLLKEIILKSECKNLSDFKIFLEEWFKNNCEALFIFNLELNNNQIKIKWKKEFNKDDVLQFFCGNIKFKSKVSANDFLNIESFDEVRQGLILMKLLYQIKACDKHLLSDLFGIIDKIDINLFNENKEKIKKFKNNTVFVNLVNTIIQEAEKKGIQEDSYSGFIKKLKEKNNKNDFNNFNLLRAFIEKELKAEIDKEIKAEKDKFDNNMKLITAKNEEEKKNIGETYDKQIKDEKNQLDSKIKKIQGEMQGQEAKSKQQEGDQVISEKHINQIAFNIIQYHLRFFIHDRIDKILKNTNFQWNKIGDSLVKELELKKEEQELESKEGELLDLHELINITSDEGFITNLIKKYFNIDTVNEESIKALLAMSIGDNGFFSLKQKAHYLFYGPPGTGKTTFVPFAIKRYLESINNNPLKEYLEKAISYLKLSAGTYDQGTSLQNGLKNDIAYVSKNKNQILIVSIDECEQYISKREISNMQETSSLLTLIDDNDYPFSLIGTTNNEKKNIDDAAIRNERLIPIEFPSIGEPEIKKYFEFQGNNCGENLKNMKENTPLYLKEKKLLEIYKFLSEKTSNIAQSISSIPECNGLVEMLEKETHENKYVNIMKNFVNLKKNEKEELKLKSEKNNLN